MAGVSTDVTVRDGLTRAFQRMQQSVRAVNDQLEQTNRVLNQLNPNPIDDTQQAQNNLNNSLNRGSTSARGLVASIGALVASYLSLRAVTSTLKMSDEYVQTQARLNMINDGLQTTSQLNDKIFNEAQKIGASYGDMADAVANFALRAPDAFESNDEAIVFASNLNKLFNIAGAQQQEVRSATLQLTQALGSGVLRGEELNAVFEAAPNIIREIADYMEVPIGQIRKMASEGQLSADVVKQALLSATDDINEQWEKMPMTSDNFWNRIKNSGKKAFGEIFVAINEALNSERMQGFIDGIVRTIEMMAAVAIPLLDAVSAAVAFLYDNWALLEPMVVATGAALAIYLTYLGLVRTYTWGVAAAQLAWNAAIKANPIVRVIMIIIALITIIATAIAATNHWGDTSISVMGAIAGGFAVMVAFIANLFIMMWNVVAEAGAFIWNIFADMADFIGNVFNDPLKAAAKLFVDFASRVVDLMSVVAEGIDFVFRTDYAGKFDRTAQKMRDWGGEKFGGTVRQDTAAQFQPDFINLGDAWDYGYKKGSNFSWSAPDIPGMGDTSLNMDSINSIPFDELAALGGISDSGKDTAKNTAKTAAAAGQLADDLKYLRELAAQEAINRYTTASISVDMSGMSNNINNNMDLDGVVDYLTTSTEEAINNIASGV